jgi:hypothetical protein
MADRKKLDMSPAVVDGRCVRFVLRQLKNVPASH